jgi:hypothetical protein
MAGQTPNFRCSHTLSLTAAIRAKGKNPPHQSKTKCSKEPKREINKIPNNSQTKTGFLINQSPYKLIQMIHLS